MYVGFVLLGLEGGLEGEGPGVWRSVFCYRGYLEEEACSKVPALTTTAISMEGFLEKKGRLLLLHAERTPTDKEWFGLDGLRRVTSGHRAVLCTLVSLCSAP